MQPRSEACDLSRSLKLSLVFLFFLLSMAFGPQASAESGALLDAEGFLSPDFGQEEYVEISPQEGRWVYLSGELSVTVTRYTQEDPALVWFESEIKMRGNARMTSCLSPGKTPGKRIMSPIKLAQDKGAVLAISDDFFSNRKNNDRRPGIIIRNGEVLGEKTYKSGQPSFPNLETIALFEDGSLKTYASDAYTAEEYLAMGATDVYAFGPILVSEGCPGEHMADADYYPYREPRCALGMIAPHHYIVLTVKGRSEESKGVHLPWLAERMMALGATEALNLDGGGSVALLFMGEIINHSPKSKNIRGLGSLIGFGTSPSLMPKE